jgi:ubiquinone/menaquinone biosynthesis C-methylase UbiE
MAPADDPTTSAADAARIAATQSFYGRWARLYDRLATAPGVTSWRERTVAALDLDAGDTAVEMGCGTGANLPFLREAVGPTGTILGGDVTRGMLARARDRAASNGWDNVVLVQADATRPPLAVDRFDGGIDGLLAAFVVGMVPDPAAAVQDWCDLVGPGGRVALLNFQRSRRLLALPLNLAFEGFVWLSSPGRGAPSGSPAASLAERVGAARTALTDRTVDRRYEAFAGGYLGLLSGRVE